MDKENKLNQLDIEALFSEIFAELGFDESDRERMFEAFLHWYRADLKERWQRKLRWWLTKGWKNKKH